MFVYIGENFVRGDFVQEGFYPGFPMQDYECKHNENQILANLFAVAVRHTRSCMRSIKAHVRVE